MNIVNEKLLNELMQGNSLQEIIEKAKNESKRKFLEFTKGTLGVDASEWNRLWNVPILASYDFDSLISEDLSEDERAVALDIIQYNIEEEIKDATSKDVTNAVCIPFEYINDENGNNDELVKRAIENDNFSEVIFYFIPEIKKTLKEYTEKESETFSIEELKDSIVSLITEILIHERCHANSIYRIKDNENEDVAIYGARGTYDAVDETEKVYFYKDQDEILTDTIARMMNLYKVGDNVEDSLLRVIEKRGGKNPYIDMDDNITLLLMSLFPDEITRWAVLGTHESEEYHNLIEEKINEVFGENLVKLIESGLINIQRKVENYFVNMDKSNLSVEQLAKRIRMLQLMGLNKEKLLNITNIDNSEKER